MAVHQWTVALFVAVALVAGPAISYAVETSNALAGAQPKATTEEQQLIEKANIAFKAAVAAAAVVAPADKYKTFQATFSLNFGWSIEGITGTFNFQATFTTRIAFAQLSAYHFAKGATLEAKYEAFVAILSESLRIIAGILEVHAVKPAGEEVKGAIPADELKAIDQIDAAFRTAAAAADAAPLKHKFAVFKSAFNKAIKETTGGAYEGYKFVPDLVSSIKKIYGITVPKTPKDKLLAFESALSKTILAMAAAATAPSTPTAATATATATPTPEI
ncbi:hypothetical protein CFC21_056236 [Triticum aestivum]|uniref:Pollen allergen Poa p IX/Phl p VI domain-containing protein n=2 Tax=Triticum aestivum TaxID=4565 RepID=A0A9R1GGW6_WHEAT|nr:pollen allergen Phl p 5.0101-like [Triticum aestivum]KAF7047292.1 hypothetical protein CFC21_056236 [Triticum aestivum]